MDRDKDLELFIMLMDRDIVDAWEMERLMDMDVFMIEVVRWLVVFGLIIDCKIELC